MGGIRSCGFLRIFTYTDHGILKVRLGKVRIKEGPAGLEPSKWAKNKRKATVKLLRNPQVLISTMI